MVLNEVSLSQGVRVVKKASILAQSSVVDIRRLLWHNAPYINIDKSDDGDE